MTDTQTTAARPRAYDRLKSRKKPVTRSVLIATDSEIADDYQEAKAALDVAKLRMRNAKEPNDQLRKDYEGAEAEFKKAKATMKENSEKFLFRSLSPKKYDRLVSEHAPTDEQKQKLADIGQDPDSSWFNGETFPQALVAASLITPELSLEEVRDLWEDENWNGAELMSLFNAALDVNSSRRVIELGNG